MFTAETRTGRLTPSWRVRRVGAASEPTGTLTPVVRLFVIIGALLGFLGVLLSAAARHATNAAHLQTVSQFLLFHAPAVMALAALIGTGLVQAGTGAIAGGALVVGLALFCGDLAARDFLARPLFHWAAPSGGLAMMAGWLLVVVAALLGRG